MDFQSLQGRHSPFRSSLLILLLGVCLAVVGLAACGSQDARSPGTGADARTIEEVLEAHNEELLAIEGVIGTGIHGRAEDSVIFVIVEHPDEETLARIPQHLEGFPVVTVDAERIREMTGLETP